MGAGLNQGLGFGSVNFELSIGHPHEEDKWAIAHVIRISWEKSELRAFLTHGQSL